MPTMFIQSGPETRKEKGGRQLRLSLPGMRVPVQSAAVNGVPNASVGHGAATPLWYFPAPGPWAIHRQPPVLNSPPVLRQAQDEQPQARDVLRQAQDERASKSELPPGAAAADGQGQTISGEPGYDNGGAERSLAPSPVVFAREVLGVRLWEKQEEVLNALTSNRRVAVKAGNGLGKGFCAAVAVLWYMHTHPEAAITLTTAPTFRQVRHILWRQIHRLYNPVADALGGTMFDTRWELSDDRYALGLSADGADQFQGFHSPHMFIVVDEAEGVSEEIYEAIESVMTSANPLLLLIGNPTSMSGAFRRAFYEERAVYHPITISALESPNVQAGRIVFPGLTTADWVDERKQIWGGDSSTYRSRVLGEFPDQGEDSLFSLGDLEGAVRNVVEAVSWTIGAETVTGVERTAGEEAILAVDVARFGSDRSVILRRRGECVEDIRVLTRMDTMQLTGWVSAAIRECRPAEIRVDEIGVGAGVVDRLRELGHEVRGVNVANRARDDKLFANLRAEGFWGLRERFRSGRISIPDDSQLISELTSLRYSYDSSGRIRMESKDDMRRRGLPSPDKADALMLAFLEAGGRLRLWT